MDDLAVAEADYVIIGGGAMGMAFADVILTETDATIAMIDRGNRPGGHWNHAYPFVRLHQPSAFYGLTRAHSGATARTPTDGTRGSTNGFSSAEPPTDELMAVMLGALEHAEVALQKLEQYVAELDAT